MNDRDYLIWLHERLTEVHGERQCVDYMHKLRAIIKTTPKEKCSQNMATGNSLEELKRDYLQDA